MIAGGFTTAGNIGANRVAVLDPGVWPDWSALGSGMDGSVSASTTWNGALVAAGSFTTAGGTAANGIARWTGTAWEPLVATQLGGGCTSYLQGPLATVVAVANAAGFAPSRCRCRQRRRWSGSR